MLYRYRTHYINTQRKRSRLPALLTAFFLLLTSSAFSPASVAAQEAEPAIKLRAGTFVPGQQPVYTAMAADLSITGYAPGEEGYYIVQFRGPVEPAWKDQLIEAGGELLDYLPDYAYKVRMTPAEAAQIEQIEAVNWVGLFQPAYKLNPALDYSEPKLYSVRIERGIDPGLTADEIGATGIDVVARNGNMLTVVADADQIKSLAQVLDVAWIDELVLVEKHNEYAAGVILGANAANANGYDGSSQIVAVADSGIGGGAAATAHPDIPASRIVDIYDWPGAEDYCFSTVVSNGAMDVASGHGTHVATSVVGDGDENGLGKAAAPAAGLVFQAIEDYAFISQECQAFGYPSEGYFLIGIPADLRDLFQQAYDAGARTHANSWGASVMGEYTTSSANLDSFIWANPDMSITFSAGNGGVDSDEDGIVDADSIGSPATAKNVISVGASENDRDGNYPCDTTLTYPSIDHYQDDQTCAAMEGINIISTAGGSMGFTAEPLSSDLTAGNSEQMAPFSSRGPTDDGRIKPDVVAPGTWILSGYSGYFQQGYGPDANPQNGGYQYDGWGMPANGAYKYMGGTSMANPIAAGAAVVVRDFYSKTASLNASAALVKATLINSAVDLLDENNDGDDDNDFPIPNDHEGWGRIDLAAATDGSFRYVDQKDGLTTDESAVFHHLVAAADGASPLRITLVWSDYPATELAGQNLTNDLDLKVLSPDGATYPGNKFSGGWSSTGNSYDRVNNVENVYIEAAAAGVWTVEVHGHNVPVGPQPYALIVDATFSENIDSIYLPMIAQ